jgi:hypothetical protein
MRRFIHILLFAVVALLPSQAWATNISTANPNYPDAYDDIDAEPLRGQFDALINDIDNLWAAINPLNLSANQVAGTVTGGSPTGLVMPSCHGTDNVLIWTPGVGFGCSSIVGSVVPLTPTARQFVNGFSSEGAPLTTQPAFSDLSGTISVSQYLAATGTTIGAVKPDGVTTAVNNGVISTIGGSSGVTAVTSGGTGSALGNAYGLYGTPIQSPQHLVDIGDSITYGYPLSSQTQTYEALLAQYLGATYDILGINGSYACDTDWQQAFLQQPTLGSNTDYTIMVGTNEAYHSGTGAYEANYHLCHQAELSWLAVPSQFKTMGTACTETGSWTTENTYFTGSNVLSSTNGSTLTCSITTYGGPVYAWYELQDGIGGTATWILDSTTNGSFASETTPAINIQVLHSGAGNGLIRIPTSAGTHSIQFTVTSSSGGSNWVSIVGVGTPAPYNYPNAPSVFSAGVPHLVGASSSLDPAAIQYNSDSLADATLLRGDGLPIYFVPIQNYINTSTDYYSDGVHWIASGHVHAAQGYEGIGQFVPYVSPYDISGGTPVTISGCSNSGVSAGAKTGKFVSGVTGTCTATITVNGTQGNTAPNGYECDGNDIATSAKLAQIAPISATNCSISGPTTSGDTVTFNIHGW